MFSPSGEVYEKDPLASCLAGKKNRTLVTALDTRRCQNLRWLRSQIQRSSGLPTLRPCCPLRSRRRTGMSLGWRLTRSGRRCPSGWHQQRQQPPSRPKRSTNNTFSNLTKLDKLSDVMMEKIRSTLGSSFFVTFFQYFDGNTQVAPCTISKAFGNAFAFLGLFWFNFEINRNHFA